MKSTAPWGLAPPLRGPNEKNIPTEQPTAQAYARLPHSHEQSRRAGSVKATARQGAQTVDGKHSTEAAVLTQAGGYLRLPRSRRIRKRTEFVRLQRGAGRRAGPRFVVITEVARHGVSRLGITASRKVGGAVVRNRIKRLVREFFRHYQQQLVPSRDVLVIVRPSAADASCTEVEHELAAALKIALTR
jgi:ribonuclease P protein component